MSKPEISICWLRRDLRLDDNAALYHALKSGFPVVPVFCFDTNILDDLEDKKDNRVQFIHDAIIHLQYELEKIKSSLHVFHGTPLQMFEKLISIYNVKNVYTNNDYEQYAIERDDAVKKYLEKNGVVFHTYKDHVIFEKDEVMKADGTHYAVFTPYSRKWKEKLNAFYVKSYPVKKYLKNFYKQSPHSIPSLKALGFSETDFHFTPPHIPEKIIKDYDKTRDYPAVQ